jgi:hypothetical protein
VKKPSAFEKASIDEFLYRTSAEWINVFWLPASMHHGNFARKEIIDANMVCSISSGIVICHGYISKMATNEAKPNGIFYGITTWKRKRFSLADGCFEEDKRGGERRTED